MALVVMNEFLPTWATSILDNATLYGWTFIARLYSNNHTPAVIDTQANYTEASFPGYALLPLVNADWLNVGIVSGINYQQANHGEIWSTENLGSLDTTVYGYYVTEQSTNKLAWAEPLPTPYTMHPFDVLDLIIQLAIGTCGLSGASRTRRRQSRPSPRVKLEKDVMQ